MSYDEIIENIDMDQLVKKLTGRKGGLRPSNPGNDNGLYKYIWRWARFHSGADTTMPVMISYDLDHWLKDNGYEEVGYFINTDEKKKFLDDLEKVVDEVLEKLGESKYNGALRWRRALGRI